MVEMAPKKAYVTFQYYPVMFVVILGCSKLLLVYNKLGTFILTLHC